MAKTVLDMKDWVTWNAFVLFGTIMFVVFGSLSSVILYDVRSLQDDVRTILVEISKNTPKNIACQLYEVEDERDKKNHNPLLRN